MYDTHAMEETEEGLKLTSTLVVTSPLKWLWIKLVAQNVADTIAEETVIDTQLNTGYESSRGFRNAFSKIQLQKKYLFTLKQAQEVMLSTIALWA